MLFVFIGIQFSVCFFFYGNYFHIMYQFIYFKYEEEGATNEVLGVWVNVMKYGLNTLCIKSTFSLLVLFKIITHIIRAKSVSSLLSILIMFFLTLSCLILSLQRPFLPILSCLFCIGL